MSIDTHTYPIPLQGLDQKSQRTSLQRGGFSSMMDVLTQNETMNQEDNDSFIIPSKEGVILPVEATTPETQIVEKEQPETHVLPKESVEENPVVHVEPQNIQTTVSPVLLEEGTIIKAIDPSLELDIDVPVTNNEIVVQDFTLASKSTVKEAPLPQYSPIPQSEGPIQIDVPFIEDVPEVLREVLPKLLATPKNEALEIHQPAQAQSDSIDVSRVLPKTDISTREVKRATNVQEPDLDLDETKSPIRPQQQTVHGSRSLEQGINLEEDPKIRFVQYVEKEVITPTFSKNTQEQAELPEGMQVQKDPQASNIVAQSNVVAVENAVRPVSGTARAEGVQAGSALEKGGLKEEVKLPKQKLPQSFAKLLKEAKDLAEDFEPEFHAKILQKLEIQVRDPAGVIQLEIAQKEAVIHVRAVVPIEAMSDLHYLGQDVQDSLQDMGLQLGSYELRSNDDDDDGPMGFGGIEEVAFDDLETEDVESIHSDYIVDKRI